MQALFERDPCVSPGHGVSRPPTIPLACQVGESVGDNHEIRLWKAGTASDALLRLRPSCAGNSALLHMMPPSASAIKTVVPSLLLAV